MMGFHYGLGLSLMMMKYSKSRLVALLHYCGKEPIQGKYGLLLLASAIRVLDYFEKGNCKINTLALQGEGVYPSQTTKAEQALPALANAREEAIPLFPKESLPENNVPNEHIPE